MSYIILFNYYGKLCCMKGIKCAMAAGWSGLLFSGELLLKISEKVLKVNAVHQPFLGPSYDILLLQYNRASYLQMSGAKSWIKKLWTISTWGSGESCS